MKKLAIGCLVFALIAAIAGGVVVWQRVVLPLWQASSGLLETARIYHAVQDLDAQVRNRRPFDPPDDGRLEPEQLRRLLAVQREMHARISERFAELEQRYQALRREFETKRRDPSLGELIGAYQDLGSLMLEAKQAQVDALNRHGLSLAEYHWIRNQAYRAIGQQLAGAAALQQAYVGDAVAVPLPDETRRLVAEHAEELSRHLSFLWFGL